MRNPSSHSRSSALIFFSWILLVTSLSPSGALSSPISSGVDMSANDLAREDGRTANCPVDAEISTGSRSLRRPDRLVRVTDMDFPHSDESTDCAARGSERRLSVAATPLVGSALRTSGSVGTVGTTSPDGAMPTYAAVAGGAVSAPAEGPLTGVPVPVKLYRCAKCYRGHRGANKFRLELGHTVPAWR
jgi:hypothetical protein